MLDATLSRIDNEMEQNLKRLFDFLKIRSISTDPQYKKDCVEAANWLVEDLKSFGAKVEKYDTGGHPIVLGHLGPETGLHILFYGHYDVQPVDPLELWDRDPFNPVIDKLPSGNVIRARGASDDKGQLMTFVEACRAWISQNSTLPFKVTFFFEGEEESGSPNLVPFMKKYKKKISSDIVLILFLVEGGGVLLLKYLPGYLPGIPWRSVNLQLSLPGLPPLLAYPILDMLMIGH